MMVTVATLVVVALLPSSTFIIEIGRKAVQHIREGPLRTDDGIAPQ